MVDEPEDGLLRSVALQNAQSILAARQRAEQELRRTKDAFERLAAASIAIASAASGDALLAAICKQARELVGAHQCVTRLAVGHDWPSALRASSLSDNYAASPGGPSADPSALYSRVCGDGKPVRLTQAELLAHPAFRIDDATEHQPPMRGWLAAPLIGTDGGNLGVIALSDKYEGDFSELDELVLVQFCRLAATSLENLRLYDKVATRGRHAALAAEVGTALMEVCALDHKLARIAASIVEHLDAAFARIWTYEEHEQVLVLRASAGLYTNTDGRHARTPLGGACWIGRIAESRSAHTTNDVLDDELLGDREWAWRERIVGFAGYPLVVGDHLLGVLAVFTKHSLPVEATVLLGEIADRVALSIERDRLDIEQEERERFRELFIGMLGHDLRNPLTAISTGITLLEVYANEFLHGDMRSLGRMPGTLDRLKNTSRRMARMIDQILDFTRSRSGGGIPISRAPGDVHDICRAVVEEMETAFPDRRLETRYLGDGSGMWDADRLSQVFSNLLGNALTYGDANEPVRVFVHDADRDHVAIHINNEGPPIPPEALSLIFDPFRRAQQAKAKGTKGLGLGLYITRQIVLAHNGTIEVRSSTAGTTFRIIIPRTARSPEHGAHDRIDRR